MRNDWIYGWMYPERKLNFKYVGMYGDYGAKVILKRVITGNWNERRKKTIETYVSNFNRFEGYKHYTCSCRWNYCECILSQKIYLKFVKNSAILRIVREYKNYKDD